MGFPLTDDETRLLFDALYDKEMADLRKQNAVLKEALALPGVALALKTARLYL